MFDLHSHCLPGIDDGAKSKDEALLMLREAYEKGTEAVAATPHIRPYTEDDIKKAVAQRERAYSLILGEAGIPEIIKGFEVYLGAEITQHTNFRDLCIEGTDCMLIEMPFRPWDSFALERLELIKRGGVMPVLAHVERYINIGKNKSLLLGMENVIYQINAEAFFAFGTRHFANMLIRSGRPVVIGSDMHDPVKRKSRMAEAYKKVGNRGNAFARVFEGTAVKDRCI